MKILAIDTSSKNCSIAIVDFSNESSYKIIAQENSDNEKTHSQKLMPLIDKVFSENNLTLKDIDYLACCIGPGSFTGIRIGIATVKAFSDSLNIPIIPVNSLESLAYNVNENGYIFPIIDAKNQNIYCELFLLNSNNYQSLSTPSATNIDLINKISSIDENKDIYFIGDGANLYKDQLSKFFSNNNIIFSENNIQSAVSLARCAYNKYLNNDYGDSSYISPLYLRKSQAERIADGENK